MGRLRVSDGTQAYVCVGLFARPPPGKALSALPFPRHSASLLCGLVFRHRQLGVDSLIAFLMNLAHGLATRTVAEAFWYSSLFMIAYMVLDVVGALVRRRQ